MYPKLMMALNIVKDYIKPEELIVKGFIVSEKPTAENKVKIQKKSQVNKGYCIEHLCVKLLTKKTANITKGNSILKDFALNDFCLFDSISLHYIEADDKPIDVSSFC